MFDAWTFDGESPIFWVTRALLEIDRIWGNESEMKTKKSILDWDNPRNLSRFPSFGNGNKKDMDKFRNLLVQLIREASAKQKEQFFYGIDLIMSNGKNNCPIGLKILLSSTNDDFRTIVSNPESVDCDSLCGTRRGGFRRTLVDLARQVKCMELHMKANRTEEFWKIEIGGNSNDSEHLMG